MKKETINKGQRERERDKITINMRDQIAKIIKKTDKFNEASSSEQHSKPTALMQTRTVQHYVTTLSILFYYCG